jgi:hypothetical protein
MESRPDRGAEPRPDRAAVSCLVVVLGAHAGTSLVPPAIGRTADEPASRAERIVVGAAYLRLIATA